ncbi:MAG: hypothetical protein QOD93_7488 [Acetobacteraceae bacterium]|jgi:hypothetical protein|nr:hypothetical protein [Acetobacteraceae bacterium]
MMASILGRRLSRTLCTGWPATGILMHMPSSVVIAVEVSNGEDRGLPRRRHASVNGRKPPPLSVTQRRTLSVSRNADAV